MDGRVKVGAVMWSGHLTALRKAAERLDFVQLTAVSSKVMERDREEAERFIGSLKDCDFILLFRSTEEFWKVFEEDFKTISESVPTVSTGYDPSYSVLSTVDPEKVRAVQRYITEGGVENFENLLRYVASEFCGRDVEYLLPQRLPREGIYHPDAGRVFTDVEEYLRWRGCGNRPLVGILFSRFSWVNSDCEPEDALIRAIEERGMGVIAVFSNSSPDEAFGSKGAAWAIRRFLLTPSGESRIQLLVKLLSFPIGAHSTDYEYAEPEGVRIFKRLGLPVLSPLYSYRRSVEEWERGTEGLGSEVAWTVAMPEFEGVIEPLFAAATGEDASFKTDPRHIPIAERIKRIADRIQKWVRLRLTPPQERKIAFFLHNSACAGVELSVGAGAGLDTFESLARILNRMKEVGYRVENVPRNGRELAETIMDKKAVSEFRWTTVDEIVAKGGVLAMVSEDDYRSWFNRQDGRFRERIVSVWGEPPGEERDGVPPAMLYEGNIIVTGIDYGNAVVCVQPKRGCAGARCDGQVCRILHDPDIPPPHQYLATYRYIEEVFGAHAVVHIGTHGTLEFLPGRGVGLSSLCSPDVAIGALPHLYIYNSDNPAEGIVAKRRSYATLIDHMQTLSKTGGLYERLEELDRLLAEYEQAKRSDKSRAHTLTHLIKDAIRNANLKEIELDDDEEFEELVRKAHEVLSLVRNSRVQDGLHILGEIPQGRKRAEFIFTILRCEQSDTPSLRGLVAETLGFDLKEAMENEEKTHPLTGTPYGSLLNECDKMSVAVVEEFLRYPHTPSDEIFKRLFNGKSVTQKQSEKLNAIKSRILDISDRLDSSEEIASFLSALSGDYIPPGPSGLISRGRDDVLPTGRNFYSLDPYRVPTEAAWRVGVRLADDVIRKFREEQNGEFPENIAFYWMCSDIMWSDGETMAQIMHLLGTRPKWQKNGRLGGFEVVPLGELKRPRIDVTIRVSGITRDNFRNCIEFIDEVIQNVAALEEPPEMNFLRKHTLQRLKKKESFREATYRIFSAKPGTYTSGVNLAVYASAWKTAEDLAAIFVHHNGYAYGKETFGRKAYEQLSSTLRSVDVTYNKVVSDDHDLLGCCCYFGTHGGLTAAARIASGRDLPVYYGDTRQPTAPKIRTLSEEVSRVVRTRLLNPDYIEGMKRHGYRGAAELAKRSGRIFGWKASTGEVDDWVFDEIAQRFVLDDEMRKWFEENNPWAMEEITRRLLEAHQRGLWNADPELLEKLEDTYMEIDGWMEERVGETSGEFQGSVVDIIRFEEVEGWKSRIDEALRSLFGGGSR